MKVFHILGALFLVSCSPQEVLQPAPEAAQLRGPDGYFYEQKEFEKRHVGITVVFHRSLVELQLNFMEREPSVTVEEASQVIAFTDNSNKYVCELHIVDPAVEYDPISAGHEFLHCVNGNWHPTQN